MKKFLKFIILVGIFILVMSASGPKVKAENCPEPLTQTRTATCPEELNSTATGSVTQTRTKEMLQNCDWGEWKTTSTNCSYNCSNPLSETRTQACSDGQAGVITQTRTKDMLQNCTWGDWKITDSTCPLDKPFPNCQAPWEETRTKTCPKWQKGIITEIRTKSPLAGCDWKDWEISSNTCKTDIQLLVDKIMTNKLISFSIGGIILLGILIGIISWAKRRK